MVMVWSVCIRGAVDWQLNVLCGILTDCVNDWVMGGGGKIMEGQHYFFRIGVRNNFEAWDCCSSLIHDRPTPESKN